MSRKIVDLDKYCNKAEAFEAVDDIPTNPNPANTIGDVIYRRYGRRDVLRGALGVTAASALFGPSVFVSPVSAVGDSEDRYKFRELTSSNDENHHIAEGYDADILLRWGDAIFEDSPRFDPRTQSVESQLKQFGYNNDYIGFIELDSRRGLLCVNHEYTNEEMMFPGMTRQDKKDFPDITKELVEIEMAAHGGTVVEIAMGKSGKWEPVLNSEYNRRITSSHTEMTFSGPAAGHERMKTSADPAGAKVIGTVNNCAGGTTPWGTYLMAEENFHGYFWTDRFDEDKKAVLEGPEAASMKRYGVPGRWYNWGKYFDRFNIDKEPNESNRFGWIVEVDPFDPQSVPVKHTALGRFSHEGAETVLTNDGRVAIYSGDDNRFDYLYKYVSTEKYEPTVGKANSALLSDGTLYVARFNDDGTIDWLPLVHSQGGLTAENGFNSQADVLIDARLAADKLGATPMDRPEDAEPKGDGTVYVMLTNNHKRKAGQENAANPRPESQFGHIIEIKEDGGDHGATKGRWEILIKCGDPSVAEVGAEWNPETSEHGWFGSPDNCAFDVDGRLWVSTDQGKKWGKTGKSDGLYGVETDGTLRGRSKLFFRCPVGGELCGPYFSRDGETLFLAVQHPGTDGTIDYKGFEREATFDDPVTRWPDFQDDMPPRPAVVVVTKRDGGKIGS